MNTRVYVHAILDGAPRRTHVIGRGLEILTVRGFQMLVERTDVRPPATEQRLRRQHRIVARAARRSEAILPARFGAVVDLAELERLVTRRQRVIRAALARVRRREQMTVRIFGSPPAPRKQVAPASGAEYLRARQLAARPELSPAARAIRAALAPHVAAERLEPPRGGIVLTMHHLIDRGRSRQYRAALRAAVGASAFAGEIAVTGPLPPFAFAPELVE